MLIMAIISCYGLYCNSNGILLRNKWIEIRSNTSVLEGRNQEEIPVHSSAHRKEEGQIISIFDVLVASCALNRFIVIIYLRINL